MNWLPKILRAYIRTNVHKHTQHHIHRSWACNHHRSHCISKSLELRGNWKSLVWGQPRREIHLASPLRKVRFVEVFHPETGYILLFTLLSARHASPFSRNSRPSRRSIRKVKLLPEINYLLIREWRAPSYPSSILRATNPFRSPHLSANVNYDYASFVINVLLYCTYCANFSYLSISRFNIR